jgi:AcrR family transcriptional regulator
MSGNELARGPRGNVDPRVAKTRETLGDALVALMLERPFEQITVKQVLSRAGVGRTTFYEHFRNKDDLFQSDVADFLQWIASLLTRTGAEPRRIAPVEELFVHLSDQRDFHDALVAAGKVDEVRAAGAQCFARLRAAGVTMASADLRATSQLLAGGLFSLLDWWIRDGMRIPPTEMDALYHRTLWNGLVIAGP